MKELNNTARVTTYLKKIYSKLNEHFYNNELPKATITIIPTARAYAHFTLNENTWTCNEEGTHEINISAYYMNRPIEEVCASMSHEMTHFYNFIKGIKDTSNNGIYHNRNFKDEAEKHGINVEKHDTYGWTITTPNDEMLQFVIDNDLTDIGLVRNCEMVIPTTTTAGNGNKTPDTDKPVRIKKGNSYKWICPKCGQIARTTKPTANIICGDCMEKFIEA